MTVTYFKRFKMQIDLKLLNNDTSKFQGYHFESWNCDDELVSRHAEAKFLSFQTELDSNVFPCLGSADGCQKLMSEISGRKGFVPEATWLLSYHPDGEKSVANGTVENCGTVQGIRESKHVGSIQNLGIAPNHRGKGLGSVLLNRALNGFRSVGIETVSLEVTAQNEQALKLYKRVGFNITNIVYKSADLVY